MIKKHIVKILCIVLCIANILAVSGCGSVDSSSFQIELEKPEYQGPAENAKPRYKMSWSYIPGAQKYEVMIHTKMTGFEGNTSRYVYDKANSVSLVFLQGVYTYTVNYRVKVRAFDKEGKALEWSNVWEMDFVDGVCTMTDNAPDFPDDIMATASAHTTQPAESVVIEHELPENLVTFMAKDEGMENLDFSICNGVVISVERCEYSEPDQIVIQSEMVEKVRDAISNMEVSSVKDEISSTGDAINLYFYNDDEYVTGVKFQDGLVVSGEKRYEVSNLDQLMNLDFLMLFDDWDEYWDNQSEVENAFNEKQIIVPGNVLESAKMSSNLLYSNLDTAHVIYIRNDLVNTENLKGEYIVDTEKKASIMNLLKNLQFVKKFEGDVSTCQEWNLRILFTLEDGGYQPEIILNFKGDSVLLPDGNLYTVNGLDELLNTIDTKVSNYLVDNRNHRPVKPVF